MPRKPQTVNRKPQTLRLGTRASNLALTQSRFIARQLERQHRGLKVELIEIATTGDRVRDVPLKSFGGAGVFVKELEQALLDGQVDVAVHSLKDMPTRQPQGLLLGAIVGREDPRDVAVLAGGRTLEQLPPGSVIGSGSLRRRAQLKAQYPGLQFAEIRGNVETRLRKVAHGEYAGTILARAGLKRLKLLNKSMQTLPLSVMLPAPGQGALGIECRSNDRRTRRLLALLHNREVAACVVAERAMLEGLGGGCHLPLGALGQVKRQKAKIKARLVLRATLGLPDGSMTAQASGEATLKDARKLGRRLAREILRGDGAQIMRALDAMQVPSKTGP